MISTARHSLQALTLSNKRVSKSTGVTKVATPWVDSNRASAHKLVCNTHNFIGVLHLHVAMHSNHNNLYSNCKPRHTHIILHYTLLDYIAIYINYTYTYLGSSIMSNSINTYMPSNNNYPSIYFLPHIYLSVPH